MAMEQADDFIFDFGGYPDARSMKRFFVHCAQNEVSDITIQGNARIWVERHGRQLPATKFRVEQSRLEEIVNGIFGATVRSSLNQGEIVNLAWELVGDEKATLGLRKGSKARFRVNFTQATVAGRAGQFSVTLRVLNNKIIPLETMGFERELFEALFPGSGIVFIGGETGSGKSMMMAAIFQYLGRHYPNRKIITFERPVEYLLGFDDELWIAPEPAQSEVGTDVPSFDDGISESALRRSPKVIGVGETLNIKVAQGASAAALSGHAVYTTMHNDTCGQVFPRFIEMFLAESRESAAHTLLQTIRVSIVQRLLRSTDGRRIAVREFMIFDEELKAELSELPYQQWGAFVDNRLKAQGTTLVQKAYQLYQEGKVSREDVIEVITISNFNKLEKGHYGD